MQPQPCSQPPQTQTRSEIVPNECSSSPPHETTGLSQARAQLPEGDILPLTTGDPEDPSSVFGHHVLIQTVPPGLTSCGPLSRKLRFLEGRVKGTGGGVGFLGPEGEE